jgi:hypothetical protein
MTKFFKLLVLTIFLISIDCCCIMAQAPPGIPYQAIARNANGTPYTNASLSVRFSLHEQTATGMVSFAESHSLQTNDLGLFSTTIGIGTPITGTFTAINWAQTTKFLQVEINLGSAWLDLGTQQLMSVPYALFAGSTGDSNPAPALLSYNRLMNSGVTYESIPLNRDYETWDFTVRHNNSCCSGGANRPLSIEVTFVDANNNTLPNNSYFIYGSNGLQLQGNGSISGTTVWNAGWYSSGRIMWNLPANTIVKLRITAIQGGGGCCDPETSWTCSILKGL